MAQTVDTKLQIWQENGSYARRPSNYIDNRVLAANTAETWTVPAKCSYAIVRSNADVLYRTSGTATVPAADVSDGEGSAFLTDDLYLDNTTSISLISASACLVSFECYKEVGY